jgi:uncharacterized membrane protein
MSPDPEIEQYLAKVRAHLTSATASEEEEVLRDVSERIEEIVAKTDDQTESALEQLGPAEEVAHKYRDAHLITKASRSNSPILLLRASLRNGIPGVLAFLVGLAGYWFGGFILVFGVVALLAHTAIGSNILQTLSTVVEGIAVLALTTFLLRTLLRGSKRREVFEARRVHRG